LSHPEVMWTSIATVGALPASSELGTKFIHLPPGRRPSIMIQMGYHDAQFPIAFSLDFVEALCKEWGVGPREESAYGLCRGELLEKGDQHEHRRLTSAEGVSIETLYHYYYMPPQVEFASSLWGHCIVGSPDVLGNGQIFGQRRHFGCPAHGGAGFQAIDKILKFYDEHRHLPAGNATANHTV